MKRFWSFACAIRLLATDGLGQSPVLSYAVPSAVKPGTTTPVTLFGENLAGSPKAWASLPWQLTVAAESAEEKNSKQLRVQIAVPSKAPPAVGAIRVFTTNGVSNLLLLLIDDLPSIAEAGTNKSTASAQTLQPAIAVDGAVDELSFDYYKFFARKDERFAIEAVAQRIGSRLDPVLRLLDARGREFAYCDDEPGIGSDSRITWRSPAAGEYLLELRDALYQGGGQYRYRLRMGASALPSLRSYPNPNHLPEVLESEPNDSADAATRFTVPAVLSGSFPRSRDRDFYQFDAKKEERLVFRAKTRSIGSACEVFMQLQGTNGSKVAEARLTGPDEGLITNKFAEAGTYLLLVEELNRLGGSNFIYRVEVQPLRPGFELAVDTEKVETPLGGSFELKVSCARRDYDGPIHLSLEGAGEGFTLNDSIVMEKKTNAVLKVKVPPHLIPGEPAHFHLIGQAKIGEHEERALASTLPALHKVFPQMPYPPAELDGVIALGIKGHEKK